jgi:hypothetical protein
MNLRASIAGLIFLSALLFFSCGEDDINTIGLPPENNLGIFFVEIPLEDAISQVWVDDISSRRTGIVLAGSYTDPALGDISAQNFSEFLLPGANPGKLLGEDATLDSLVMELRMVNAYGVDLTTTQQTIEIYQLQDTIVSFEQTYFNNSSQPVGMKLGEESFRVYTDSLELEFEDLNLPDSADERALFDNQGLYIYKTNIKLDDAFAQDFFNEMLDTTSSSTFSSNQTFANYLKGFRFNGVPSNSAVMAYNPTSSFTTLTLHYTQTEEGVPVHKTIRFTINSSISYNNVTPNGDVPWTAGDLDGLTDFYTPYETDSEVAYIQAGTHLFMKLDFSIFESFGDTLENPIVQSAALLFDSPREYPSEATRLPLPDRISATVTSLDSLENGNYRVNQEVPSDLPSTAEYDEDEDRYKLELPIFIQTVINKQNPFNQVILSAVSDDPFSNALRVDNGSLKRLAIDKSNIYLRVYYTLPNAN